MSHKGLVLYTVLYCTVLAIMRYLQPYCASYCKYKCKCNRTVLATELYLQRFFTRNCTVFATILYLQPYCICNHTVPASVLYFFGIIPVFIILYSQSYCTCICTVYFYHSPFFEAEGPLSSCGNLGMVVEGRFKIRAVIGQYV